MQLIKRFHGSIQKGFSIIELMIVVAVIGIIASIAVPAYHQHMVKARLATAFQALIYTSRVVKQQFDEYGGSFTNVIQNGLSYPCIGFMGYNTAGSGGVSLQIYATVSDPAYPEIDGKWIFMVMDSHGSGSSANITTCCGLKTGYYGSSGSPSISLLPSGCNNNCYFPY